MLKDNDRAITQQTSNKQHRVKQITSSNKTKSKHTVAKWMTVNKWSDADKAATEAHKQKRFKASEDVRAQELAAKKDTK